MLLSVPTLLSFTRMRGALLTLARLFCCSARTTTSAMSVLIKAPLNPAPGMSESRPVCGSGVLRPKLVKLIVLLRSNPPIRPISTPSWKLFVVSIVTIVAWISTCGRRLSSARMS